MTNSSQIQETILKAIDAVVTQRNNELKLDKTITGIIKKNVGKRNSKSIYQVEYSGGIIEAVAQKEEDIYTPHTGVYILVPEGNFSKEKVIIGRTSTMQTDRTASVVAAAVNKYSIVGPNLLETTDLNTNIKDLKYGLHSFHPVSKDNEHGIEHRAQFIYLKERENNDILFNNERFKLYQEDTTAIMVKADFLTNLDVIQKQQPNARYGLIFTFTFDNLNKGYGETNLEVLEYISKNIVKDINVDGNIISLWDAININFINYIENENIINIDDFIKNDNGYIDLTIDIITSMYNVFKQDNAKLNIEIVQNIINALLSLLNELKYIESISSLKNRWYDWCEEIIGDAPQKDVQFVLSSDDMIGNPFAFNTWNTQYNVFNIDLNTFGHLESILFYKEGFYTDTKYENMWPIGEPGPDIFVRNLQIYAMNPLDQQSGDYTLKVEPYSDFDKIISNNPESGYLSHTQFKATLMRKFYEDLTANNKVNYLWFKEDSNVINVQSPNYNAYAGSGWRQLTHKETNYLFSSDIEQNQAYKNNYKCIAIYEPSADDKVILSYVFSIFNKDVAIDIKLESNLGTKFSFDKGTPIISVLINENRNDENSKYLEYAGGTEKKPYKYIWSINDIANGYELFLNEITDYINHEDSLEHPREAIILSGKKSLLKKIKLYYQNDTKEILDSESATRIKYPVSISSSGFTVTCYVQKYREITNSYFDIGSASLQFENSQDTSVANYRIQIINGDQVFQYDEYGNAPCAEKNKDPLEVQPLQVKLLDRSGLEIEGANYQVEWIFPLEDTMIKPLDELVLNPGTGLVQNYSGHELGFNIAELYNPDAYNNQITCHITFAGDNFYKDTNFYFGKQGNNGTNGTDVVAKIEFSTLNDPYKILHYQPLTLYVQDYDNQYYGMFNVGNTNLTEEIILAESINMQENETLQQKQNGLVVKLYRKNEEIILTNRDKIYWNVAGNTQTSVNNFGKFFSINNTVENSLGTFLTWKYKYLYNDSENNWNRRRVQILRANIKLYNSEQEYYAFFTLPIIEIKHYDITKLALINKPAIDKNFYLNEIVYNADGRNPIYNHNQGLKIFNIPRRAEKIVWTACGGWNKESNIYQEKWPCFSLLDEKNSKNGQKTITINKNDFIITESGRIESMIYVLPEDTYDGSITNNYIKAEIYVLGKVYATIYAPINMTLNTFGLASLNAWDGNTVTIDEDGGYIMAPQIGAGEKDLNNRFTGVLMGKTETYTGGASNEKEIGLFGYAHGLQSIFLNAETGDADFGLPDVNAIIDNEGNITGYKYQNSDRKAADDGYNEGRVELRPGAVSKVGGWRLGRRSLYYITDAVDLNNHNLKEISESYKDNWATKANHQRDIGRLDKGILLNAAPLPYISIKGKRLTVYDPRTASNEDNPKDFDIDNSSGNAAVKTGDSFELNLDPNQKDFFTLFRHYQENNKWKRSPLVGIDATGRFYSNALKDQETSLSMNFVPGFGYTSLEGKYAGLFVGYGTHTILKNFIEVPQDGRFKVNNPVYISGGSTNDEYEKPISMHGESISLFAKNSSAIPKGNNENSKWGFIHLITDANIKISTNEAQTQLGENTLLSLNRDINSKNILKTTGLFNWNVGVFKSENDNFQNLFNKKIKNMVINPEDCIPQSLTINNGDFTQYNYGNVNIKSAKNYTIDSWSTQGEEEISPYIRMRLQDKDNKKYSFMQLSQENVQIGIPNDRSTKGTQSIITMSNNSLNSWIVQNNELNIITNSKDTGDLNTSKPYPIKILSNGVNTGFTTDPQIEITAGNKKIIDKNARSYTQILLNTSNDCWVTEEVPRTSNKYHSLIGGLYATDGVPFEVRVGYKQGDANASPHEAFLGIRTNTIFTKNDEGNSTGTKTRVFTLYYSSSARIKGGLVVAGQVSDNTGKDSWNNGTIPIGLWVDKDIYGCKNINIKEKYYGQMIDSFADGDGTSGQSAMVSGLGNEGTGIFATVTRDINNGRLQLGSASMTVRIPSADTIYNAIKDSIASQITAALNATLANYVTTTAFTNHKHNLTYSMGAVMGPDGKTGKQVVVGLSGNLDVSTSTPLS